MTTTLDAPMINSKRLALAVYGVDARLNGGLFLSIRIKNQDVGNKYEKLGDISYDMGLPDWHLGMRHSIRCEHH
jgi:hypothetical protein